MKERVVKVDSELIKKVEELIKREKYRYVSNKQVVNLALVEFLNKHNVKLKSKGGKKK